MLHLQPDERSGKEQKDGEYETELQLSTEASELHSKDGQRLYHGYQRLLNPEYFRIVPGNNIALGVLRNYGALSFDQVLI